MIVQSYPTGVVTDPQPTTISKGEEIYLGEIVPPILWTVTGGSEGIDPDTPQCELRITNTTGAAVYSLSLWFESDDTKDVSDILSWVYISPDGSTYRQLGVVGSDGKTGKEDKPVVLGDNYENVISGSLPNGKYTTVYLVIKPPVSYSDVGGVKVIDTSNYDGVDSGVTKLRLHISWLDYEPDTIK